MLTKNKIVEEGLLLIILIIPGKAEFKEKMPGTGKIQTEGFTWLIAGIFENYSINPGLAVGKIPGLGKRLSNVKRFGGILNNNTINMKKMYNPIAKEWLQALVKPSQQIKLILERTKIRFCYQFNMVSISYRKRSIPICWTWVKYSKGRSNGFRFKERKPINFFPFSIVPCVFCRSFLKLSGS